MLDKGKLISDIESAFRSMEQGEDGVTSLANLLGNAFDLFVKSGTVKTDSIGGGCNHSGTHPPVHSEGMIE